MKILTWNINGIRAVKGKSTKKLLDSLKADVICLQETKVTRDMLDEPTAIVEGYDAYFSFSRKRTGYSGTANYCSIKTAPVKAEEGLTGRLSNQNESIIECYGNMNDYSDEDLDALDAEGRCIITQHQIKWPGSGIKDVAIINVYVPRAGDREDRLQYKLKFLTLLQSRAEALLRKKIHVIILGDLNLFHRKLDNCDPQSEAEFLTRSSRTWMNGMLQKSERDPSLPAVDSKLSEFLLPDLEGGHFSDVYRSLHPNQESAFTNWCTVTDARKSNYGRRLDYILIDTELAQRVVSCDIMAEVEGSDHCPVVVTLNCDPMSSSTCPLLCSKFLPEFKGQQQKLSSFFIKSVKPEAKVCDSHEVVSVSSSPEDSEAVPCSPLKKSSSLPSSPPVPKTTLKRNSSTGVKSNSSGSSQEKVSLKRGTTAPVKGNNKKTKTKQDESGSKQKSLTSFFTKAGSSKDTLPKIESTTVPSGKPVSQMAVNADKNGKVSDSSVLSDRRGTNQALSSDDSDITIIPSTNNLSSLDSLGSSSSQQSDVSVPDAEASLSVKVTTLLEEVKNSSSGSAETATTVTQKMPAAATSTTDTSAASSQAWKSLLKGPAPPPLCPGHKEPCVLKTVNKKGPNKNKQFYCCARPEGAPGNPEFRCNYFRWLNDRKKKP